MLSMANTSYTTVGPIACRRYYPVVALQKKCSSYIQNLMYTLDTVKRRDAAGNMFDFKRRTSEVRRADDRPQKTKNSSKMAAVAKIIDDITNPVSSKSLHLPKIVQSRESVKSSLVANVGVDYVSFCRRWRRLCV